MGSEKETRDEHRFFQAFVYGIPWFRGRFAEIRKEGLAVLPAPIGISSLAASESQETRPYGGREIPVTA
jgi:hypothetical protein